MDAIRQWVFSICAAAIVGAIVSVLSPGGSGGTKKIMRLCVSIFFLCCLFSPVLEFGVASLRMPELPEPATEITVPDLEHAMDEQIILQFRRNIADVVDQALRKAEINALEIGVSVNVDDRGSISINEVKVILSDRYIEKEREAIRAVEEQLGVTPEIRFRGN